MGGDEASNRQGEAEGPEDLKALTEKILKKYGTLSMPSKESSAAQLVEAPATDAPDSNNENVEYDDSSSSANVKICARCNGVGKVYENHSLSDFGGMNRVIESCCLECSGAGYIILKAEGDEKNPEAKSASDTQVGTRMVHASQDSHDDAAQLDSFGPCPFLLKKNSKNIK